MPVLADARGWFTLEVPEGWDMKTEDSVTTLRSPQGGGVVYLSGARHVGGHQTSFGRADFLSRCVIHAQRGNEACDQDYADESR